MHSRYSHTMYNRMIFLFSVLMMAAFVLSACMPAATPTAALAGGSSAAKQLSIPPQQQNTLGSAEPTISVATDAKLGKILVGDNGMTLYIFTKDTPDKSNCNAKCLASWPALITQGSPKLGAGVDAALVGSTALADGSKIVTYNKMPLYYFAEDAKPGDIAGQGIGNVWYVISPEGKVIGNDASSAAAAPVTTSAPTATIAPAPTATMAPAPTAVPMAAPAITEPSISIATAPKLGKFLVGDNGMTLYIFTKDGPDQSNCNAACLQKWPPLLTLGKPTLGEGVDPALIGTATLADGRLVVTYNKMPLYYFVGDGKAGDTTGEGVGGVWFVISPLGALVQLALRPAQPSPGGGYGGGMGGGHYP